MAMGKRSKHKRKRERGGVPRDHVEGESSSDGAQGWKKVEVGLSEDALVPGNHYDAPDEEGADTDDNEPEAARTNKKTIHKKRRRHLQLDPDQDLEAGGGEDMGFFFGLEVISPDSYQLETDPATGIKRFRVLKDPNEEKEEKAATKESSPAASLTKMTDSTAPRKVEAGLTDAIPAALDKEGGSKEEKLGASDSPTNKKEEENDSDEISRMQLAWLSSTGGVELHPALCRGLLSLGFWTPTPIQAATLPASILGQRNIVGAAPTGSGKTLSYLLPILQELLHSYYSGSGERGAHQQPKNLAERSLRALILSPTRELALQIQQACESLLPRAAVVIVGGLAVAKQTRLLDRKPPIVIGTPGRLWDLISKQAHPHLRDLSQIQHLVVDEADRMIQQGSFPELSRIFDAIHLANPMDDDSDDDDHGDAEGDSDTDEEGRLLRLPGLPGEAKVQMLSADILERIERQRQDGTPPEPIEESDEEADDDSSLDDDVSQSHDKADEDDTPVVLRRTYVYSATLTLPATSSSYKKKHRKLDVDGAIAEILDKARAHGQTKIVDLTSSGASKKFSIIQGSSGGDSTSWKPDIGGAGDSFRLPPGLSLYHIKCTQKHKDSHLYAYLMTTEQGAKGPCLVFCNSIAAVRRVGATLMTLGSDVRILHAQMQQRARLKAVESLQNSTTRAVVVATDVAARGLDIPSVASVVHYDVPRTVDVFVHRSGRTARGVGENAVGSCLSLVAPSDDKNYSRIVQALKAKIQTVHLDGRLLRAAQERVNLACKVVSAEGEERKVQREKKWFHEQADEAGLEVDESLIETSESANRSRQGNVRRARAELAQLLSQPMQTQRYGKFLSTNSSRTTAAIPASVNPNSHTRRRKSG